MSRIDRVLSVPGGSLLLAGRSGGAVGPSLFSQSHAWSSAVFTEDLGIWTEAFQESISNM